MLPRLTYFDVRGRAEPIRMLLEEAGVEYTERRVKLEEWAALKPTFPMEQLPIYEEGEGDDAVLLFHSMVIRRYLAKKHGLQGNDDNERLQCEMVAESILDAQNNIGTLMWNPEFEKLRKSYETESLPPLLEKLQRHKQRNTAGGLYWVGDSVTYVDFAAWCFLDYVRAFSTATLQKFGPLYSFYTELAKRPRIAAYLSSERRPKTLTVSVAPFGGTPETS